MKDGKKYYAGSSKDKDAVIKMRQEMAERIHGDFVRTRMNTNVKTIPLPLSGTEIKLGIAVRMTRDLPEDVREPLKDRIIEGLGKTCSLLGHTAYAKFKATWKLNLVERRHDRDSCRLVGHLRFERFWTRHIGRNRRVRLTPPDESQIISHGTIDEVPPDRFRRETDQPIPKPTELKPKEHGDSTFSKSIRGSGKRRDV